MEHSVDWRTHFCLNGQVTLTNVEFGQRKTLTLNLWNAVLVRLFRSTNSTVVSVNLPIETKVGFASPQSVPWSSDVNQHPIKKLQWVQRFYKLTRPCPAIGAQAWFCMDKRRRRIFRTVEYGISNTRETTWAVTQMTFHNFNISIYRPYFLNTM